MRGSEEPFGWPARLKCGLLGALAGWWAGWAICIPFKYVLARRYVDGQPHQLPLVLGEGLVVWAAFSLFMGAVGFLPVMLPVVLWVPARWMVRWRVLLTLAAPLVAMVALYHRMGLIHEDYFLWHRRTLRAFFFTAPNFFVLAFAPVAVWVYLLLAKRRLAP